MIRHAKRPLTGPSRSWAYYRSEDGWLDVDSPEIKLGRRPGSPDDTQRRVQYHGDGTHTFTEEPAKHRGQPAVTVDLNASRSGARTFESPEELTRFAAELTEAAQWLTEAQMFGPQSDDEADAAEAERMSAEGWSLGPDGWEP